MTTKRELIPLLLINLIALFLLAACTTGGNRSSSAVETSTPTESLLVLTPTHTPVPEPATSTAPPPTSTPEPQAGSASIGDPYAPELGNSGYDVQAYNLQFDLDPAQAFVKAQAEVIISSSLPALNRLSLDFAGYEIESLQVNGQPAAFERQDRKLWIDLPAPLFFGETTALQIVYSGQPPDLASPYVPFVSHLGLYFPGGTIFTLSEPDGAHFWYPCNNHPLDKAEYAIRITVPGEFTALSNGTLIEQRSNSDGTTTYLWQHPFPMAPYLSMLAVGQYQQIEERSPGGIPIRHYIYPDRLIEFQTAAAVTGEALDWMAELYGPYPFEAFGFVTTRLVSLASETQTMVILPETSLNEETVIHEIAHMWFGDWVSLTSWSDMWLKEGAAIYTYLLWQTRENPQDLDYFMRQRTERLQANPSGYALNELPKSQLLGTDTYWRGAAVFHALRQQIGDPAFFTGLRTFIQRFGGGNASADDFFDVMQEISGQDLQNFRLEWIESPWE